MKKYYCKNGETVDVEIIDSSFIAVWYKGKKYIRFKNIIGNTIFETPYIEKVSIGSMVRLKDLDLDEIFTVYFAEIEHSVRYVRGGGAYYGARVEINQNIDYNDEIPDDVLQISKESPLGKACLNKSQGDEFLVILPNNKKEHYKILEIL